MTRKTSAELGAEKWLREHGYKFKILKRIPAKTVYNIGKNDLEMQFELSHFIVNGECYMRLFEIIFKMTAQARLLEDKIQGGLHEQYGS